MTSLALDNDTYSITIYEYSEMLKEEPEIAVDSLRFYLMLSESESVKGVYHSNVSRDKHYTEEFGSPQWKNYRNFSSSNEGRYISFRHSHKASTEDEEQTKWGAKLLALANEPENEFAQTNRPGNWEFKITAFYRDEEEDCLYPTLSRDGHIWCLYNTRASVTYVYQIREEAGKDPVVFMNFELSGRILAVSGKGNRIMMETAEQLGIYDITEDESELVYQTNMADFCIRTGALNEDGSEAAFSNGDELRVVDVDKAIADKVDQAAIVRVPESVGRIHELVYDDGNKLHARHDANVWLFDPLTKEFALLYSPQEGQKVIRTAISPSADYIAILEKVNEEEGGIEYRVTVKKKRRRTSFTRDNNAYSAIVYEGSEIFKHKGLPPIAVDSTRLYLISYPEGVKGIYHSATSEDKHHIDFGNPQWNSHIEFDSSHDGRYISSTHSYEVSLNGEEQSRWSGTLFALTNEPENGKLEGIVIHDSEEEDYAHQLLSRDGHTLVFYGGGASSVTRVYQIVEEAGKSPTASLKCELNGVPCAVSGKGNRIMVEMPGEKLEIYDIAKDAELICQINIADLYVRRYALNEDGSEAAFNNGEELRIVKVDRVVGDKADQAAIVKFPMSIMMIDNPVYGDGNKMYVCQEDRVWLCDPLRNELTLLHGPQKGQASYARISPNADYIAVLEQGNEGEDGTEWRVTVRRRL